MSSLFYVFIGGGLGSLCRYGIGQAWDSSHFYLGTFLANVISCLILGFLIGMSSESLLKSPHRLLLMTGFCGCLLYTSPSPRDRTRYRMPSSA